MIQDWKQITKKSYDIYAKEYALFAKNGMGKWSTWIEEFISQFAKGAEILDLGCGAGRDALIFSEKELKVTGIDFSKELIKLSQDKVKSGNFRVMDFEDMQFQDASFDGVWAMASLLHLPKQRLFPVLRKIHAILKEGGLFFASFRLGEGERITEEKRGNASMRRFYVYYRQEKLQDMFEAAGFKDIKQELDTVETGEWVGIFVRK